MNIIPYTSFTTRSSVIVMLKFVLIVPRKRWKIERNVKFIPQPTISGPSQTWLFTLTDTLEPQQTRVKERKKVEKPRDSVEVRVTSLQDSNSLENYTDRKAERASREEWWPVEFVFVNGNPEEAKGQTTGTRLSKVRTVGSLHRPASTHSSGWLVWSTRWLMFRRLLLLTFASKGMLQAYHPSVIRSNRSITSDASGSVWRIAPFGLRAIFEAKSASASRVLSPRL